jgi:hypothetical protein
MWLISIDQMENVLNDIEKKLYACGHESAAAIVRHAFSDARECVFVPDVSEFQKCDLRVLSTDGLAARPDIFRRS